MRPKSFIGVYMARILKTCEVEKTNFYNPFLEFDPLKRHQSGVKSLSTFFSICLFEHIQGRVPWLWTLLTWNLKRSSIWLGEGDENNLDNNGKIVHHVVFTKSVGTTTNAKNIPSQEKFTSNVFDGRSLWNIKRMS